MTQISFLYIVKIKFSIREFKPLGWFMTINVINLENALEVLGQLLADRKLHYEAVAIGGGGLLLLGLIERATKDLDLVAMVKDQNLISADPIPLPLLRAAEEVALALKLGKDWLNTGPASLLASGLPSGFMNRLHIRRYKGLTLYIADRFDQICFKLYASVDQGPQSKHFMDLKALIPTSEELQSAKNWCLTQDASIAFETNLDEAISCLTN
ncbi:MAG: hypothetical protein JSR58_03180 [Verrucomicrobia bacterium]|nr:hypothetical protein [Verrucomicrobiota bacterium]